MAEAEKVTGLTEKEREEFINKMEKLAIPHRRQLKFVPNDKQSLDLSNYGLITQIDLVFHIFYTTGAAPSPNQDAVLRAIKDIRLYVGGQKDYISGDPRLIWHWLNMLHNGILRKDEVITAANQATPVEALFDFPIHIGIMDYNDPYDFSMFIAAQQESSVVLEITWADANALGTDYTITSDSYVEATVYWLEPPKDIDLNLLFPPERRLYPRFELRKVLIGNQVYDSMNLKTDLPTKIMLNRIGVITLDSNGNRRDDIVTELGISRTVATETPYHKTWGALRVETKRRHRIPFDTIGVVDIPGVDLTKTKVGAMSMGINLRGYSKGDIEIGFSTTSAGIGGTINVIFYGLKRASK